jgi:hypothetical protein
MLTVRSYRQTNYQKLMDRERRNRRIVWSIGAVTILSLTALAYKLMPKVVSLLSR